jgi:hypothetical protein
VNDFDDEIKALQRHRDLSVVRLLGHCTSEASARPMIALERLATWTSASADATYSIADRLDLVFVGVPNVVLLAGAQSCFAGIFNRL